MLITRLYNYIFFLFYSLMFEFMNWILLIADVARHRPADIRPVLASYQGRDIAKEFIERSKEHQK